MDDYFYSLQFGLSASYDLCKNMAYNPVRNLFYWIDLSSENDPDHYITTLDNLHYLSSNIGDFTLQRLVNLPIPSGWIYQELVAVSAYVNNQYRLYLDQYNNFKLYEQFGDTWATQDGDSYPPDGTWNANNSNKTITLSYQLPQKGWKLDKNSYNPYVFNPFGGAEGIIELRRLPTDGTNYNARRKKILFPIQGFAV